MTTIHRDGHNYGPYNDSEISELIASGSVSLDDLAWRDGQSDWFPLRRLLLTIPPLPLASAQPIQPYVEPGVYVGLDRVTLGSTTFATKNIGGISIKQEQRNLALPAIFFMFSFCMFMTAIFTKSHDDSDLGVTVFMFAVSIPVMILTGFRLFGRRLIYLEVAASGGVQKALESTDGKRIGRIAGAIQRVISA